MIKDVKKRKNNKLVLTLNFYGAILSFKSRKGEGDLHGINV